MRTAANDGGRRRIATAAWSRAFNTALCVSLMALALATFVPSVDEVPFHPDEASWLRMGTDAEIVFVKGAAGSLAFGNDDADADSILRILNAPLAKYVIGLATLGAGFDAARMPRDWVWGATWVDNAPAMPSLEALHAGRVAVAAVAALGAGLIYLLAVAVGGRVCGFVAALAYVFDPLVLLHGRRAMAEGVLLATLLLALLVITRVDRFLSRENTGRRPWRPVLMALLMGIVTGVAGCAKQTSLSLAAVAGAVIAWNQRIGRRLDVAPAAGQLALQTFALLTGLSGVFFLANPVIWRHPARSAQIMLEARMRMVAAQVDVIRRLDPQPALRLAPDPAGQLLNGLRIAFIAPPESWDIPLYLEQLRPAAERYLSGPHAGLPRVPATLAALLPLAALGWLRTLLSRARREEGYAGRVVLGWTAVCGFVFAVGIPIAWQRYFVGVLPIYWIGLGLGGAFMARIARSWLERLWLARRDRA